LAKSYQTFIAEATQKAVAKFAPHQKAVGLLMPKIVAANKGEKVVFTAEEQATLKNAAAAAKQFENASGLFTPKNLAALTTQINNAKGIQVTANKYAKADGDKIGDLIPEVSHWEVNTDNVSPTNTGTLAKTYSSLGTHAAPNEGVFHRIELQCYIKNYDGGSYNINRTKSPTSVWLKKRGGEWIKGDNYNEISDNSTSCDQSTFPQIYKETGLACFYSADGPGFGNDYLQPILDKARKYEAISLSCNFEETMKIKSAESPIICQWHVKLLVLIDKKGNITVPDSENSIGEGHLATLEP
jgi:hypothetical protein